MKPRSILLVDNNINFLQAVLRFLTVDNQFIVVGWAFSADEAIKKIEQYSPEVVLLDLNLPDMSGFEAIKLIKTYKNSPRVVLTSFNEGEIYRSAALAQGADAYVSKSEFGSSIIQILEELAIEIDE